MTTDVRGNVHRGPGSPDGGQFDAKHNAKPLSLGRNAHPGRTREEQIAHARAVDADIAALWKLAAEAEHARIAAEAERRRTRTPEERLADAQAELDRAERTTSQRARRQAADELAQAQRAVERAETEADDLAHDRELLAAGTHPHLAEHVTYREQQLAATAKRRQDAIDGLAAARHLEARAIQDARAADDALYEGWQRFWLVEHIHGDRHCSSFRPTTRLGWLPDISGLTEAEAVETYGPNLCTKCFPTAPVEWTLGIALEPGICPGSGQPNDTTRPTGREQYHYSPTGTCSVCGEAIGLTARHSGKIRKHKSKQEAA